nr:MAG TPA: PORTAL PROTEIN, 15 PROTEIN, HEAD PROTEIN, VIRAL INFECTION, TAILED.2A [Caudoviricetes sp.]
MTILERVKVRLGNEVVADDVLNELIATAKDRLTLRLNVEELPSQFVSIVVDVVVKMYRRTYYEGISSENAGNISTSFVDDVLSEYADEIEIYRKAHKIGMVKFI